MSKCIIICLDGTGNEVKENSVTNVFKITDIADLSDPSKQVLYYGPGVGTLPAPSAWTRAARWTSKVLGGQALGHGMRRDIGEAYTYLMNTWQTGDTVFVFGFSRGAYTARALCGMLYRVGLMRPGSENLIPYALRVYARRPGKDSDLAREGGWGLMDRFADSLARPIHDDRLSFPIEFLGLFDTVKGTGIIGPDITWPYTNQLRNVKRVVHAVSIDEWRRPFRESLVPVIQKDAAEHRVDEVWFSGIHSDIGGSFDDHAGLGKITMRWVLDAAIEAGLVVRTQRYRNRFTTKESDATQARNRNGWKWIAAGYKRRRIPTGARVHRSAATRRDEKACKYKPRLPDNVQWEGQVQWWGPPPAPAQPGRGTSD
ncbi:MAG: hypothetical protein QOC63_4831 [Mycobacterium sp.]|jgi:uncharacterized protein (DUF2235 family)|nr:hypothetical protein [Mycobacterium sp.]